MMILRFYCLEDTLAGSSSAADTDLPMLPIRDSPPILEEDPVDVDKLPRASANKKRKGKLVSSIDDQPQNI